MGSKEKSLTQNIPSKWSLASQKCQSRRLVCLNNSPKLKRNSNIDKSAIGLFCFALCCVVCFYVRSVAWLCFAWLGSFAFSLCALWWLALPCFFFALRCFISSCFVALFYFAMLCAFLAVARICAVLICGVLLCSVSFGFVFVRLAWCCFALDYRAVFVGVVSCLRML